MDPKRPRQPRAPEELRRVLSQVMIRNTARTPASNCRRAGRRPSSSSRTPKSGLLEVWDAELRARLAR